MKTIGYIVLLVLIFSAIGYWRGWFSVSKTGDSQYTVSLDKDKLKEDAKSATDKAKSVAGDITAEIQAFSTMTGTISGLDIPGGSIQVKAASGTQSTFQFDKANWSGLELSTLLDLAIGNEVTVTYESKDGQNTMKKIDRAQK